jgi:radical SAM superfamily enzyme YgiQ (UPF0313 family)
MPITQGIGDVLERPDSIVVTATDGSVITFDRAGRLYSAFLDQRFYRRGVDGRVVEKFTDDPEEGPVRRRLDPPTARKVVDRALERALSVPDARKHHLIFDLDLDAAVFRAAYEGPIPILPPDVYRALVLQATVGCAYNACLFCRFYHDRPFRIRGVDEFRSHVEKVRGAFGEGLSMRRGIFLGDADALIAQTETLLRMCEIAGQLPPAQQGISCFGAIFGEPDRSAEEWGRLHAAGLSRVHLGIETGHDPLRRRLRKPGTSEEALRLVRALKDAGIHVGLIFLLGAGGAALDERHVEDSAALCRAASLDRGDFVYLSPLVGRNGLVNPERRVAQAEAFRAKVGEGPRTAVYDIRCFVY